MRIQRVKGARFLAEARTMADLADPIDLVRERLLYAEAVRRASEMGPAGRAALVDAHEVFAASMMLAGRPDLAEDAAVALLASAPLSPDRIALAARITGSIGRSSAGEHGIHLLSAPGQLKGFPPPVDTRYGAA